MSDVAASTQSERSKYVVVTGSIAAGASTLCERLASALGWQTLLEGQIEQSNPFFADYYADQARWAAHNQLHFLAASSRRHATLRARLSEVPTQVIVEDRTPFEHSGVYLKALSRARRIPEREATLVTEISDLLEPAFLVPDLLVYRRLDDTQMQARVQERSRAGESVDLLMLTTIRDTFDEFYDAWALSPKIAVEADEDLKDAQICQRVVRSIAEALARTP